MGRFPVTEKKEQELLDGLSDAGIREADLDESFIRSSGPGGQHVNKSATAVRLLHRPSGIEVKVSQSRSQGLNRFYARRLLLERYRSEILGVSTPRRDDAAKARKQRDRRRRRTRKKAE